MSDIRILESNVKSSFRMVRADMQGVQDRLTRMAENQAKMTGLLEKLNGIEGRLTTKLASLEKQIQTKAAKPVKTVTKKVTKVVKKKVPVIKRKVMVKKVPVVKKQIIVKKIAKKAAKKFIAHKITKKLHDPHCPYAKNIL